MLGVCLQRLVVCSLFAGTALLAAPARVTAELTADQIVERAVARAQSAQKMNRQTNYAYQKRTLVEELDGKGRVKSSKEKWVQFDRGTGTVIGSKRNGKAVPAQTHQHDPEAIADRQHVTNGSRSRRDDNWSDYLNKDLISRYQFELLGKENVAGRSAYVLNFKPKSDKLPVKQITDRLINRLGGKVWIDARDFEIAKADINLVGEVTMWGGVLGAMKKFSFDIERTCVDEVWFNRVSNFELEGRKFMDSTHVRVKSETSNFRRAVAFNN
jgi:hypothetical protein